MKNFVTLFQMLSCQISKSLLSVPLKPCCSVANTVKLKFKSFSMIQKYLSLEKYVKSK